MKTELEIARAHDSLDAIINGEVPFPYQGQTCAEKAEAMAHFVRSKKILCWVLDHPHEQSFGKMLEEIERNLRAQGYELNYGGN